MIGDAVHQVVAPLRVEVWCTPEPVPFKERATGEELVAWCRVEMAAYKYPRVIEITDSLPMTATGKILKRELS